MITSNILVRTSDAIRNVHVQGNVEMICACKKSQVAIASIGLSLQYVKELIVLVVVDLVLAVMTCVRRVPVELLIASSG